MFIVATNFPRKRSRFSHETSATQSTLLSSWEKNDGKYSHQWLKLERKINKRLHPVKFRLNLNDDFMSKALELLLSLGENFGNENINKHFYAAT